MNQFQATLIGEGVTLRTPSSAPVANGQHPTWNTDGTFAGWVTASSTSPGGSGTELQYRNGASFGAVTGSSWSGSQLTLLSAASPSGLLVIETANPNFSAPNILLKSTGAGSSAGLFTFQGNSLGVASNGRRIFDALHGAAPFLRLSLDTLLVWENSGSQFNPGPNVLGLEHVSSGVLGVNSGTAGAYRDVRCRNVILTTSTPASAGATGVTGTIAWDADFLYVAVGTNTWKRVAIATW